MEHRATILSTGVVTHDVKRLVLSRPEGFTWEPGQAATFAIDESRWRDEGRPFTFTGLAEDRVLELVMKRYPEREAVTDRIHTLLPGNDLLMSSAFGTITYRGPGMFIAGGAGVTPMLAILRRLARDGALDGNSLLFSNKTPEDIICEKELRHYLGGRCLLTCTQQAAPGQYDRRVDRALLEQVIDTTDQSFYVCGPPAFNEVVVAALRELGVDRERIVLEE